jgi:CRISPR-associated protein Cas2
MLVMILEKAPTSLRGALSRWLIEPRIGVFVGNPSARVRDELWQMAQVKSRGGSVVQIWSERCAQGYRCRTAGLPKRQLVDVEGLNLVRIESEPAKPKEG